MRKLILAATSFCLLAGSGFALDPAIPLTVTSGFNADLIADGTNTAASSTTGGFDGAANVFYDHNYDVAHFNTGGSLPAGQTFNDNSGNQFSLASAIGNNALLLSSNNLTGTLNLSYPLNASLTGLLLLGSSAEGGTILNYVLNFAGGSSSSGSVTISDWYNPGASGTFNSFGKISLTDEIVGESGSVYSLYAVGIPIPEAAQLLQLQSISLTYDQVNIDDFGGFSRAAIFGVSAFDPIITSVPEPSAAQLAIGGALTLTILSRRQILKRR